MYSGKEKQNWKILLLKKYLIWEYCDILFKCYLYMFLTNIYVIIIIMSITIFQVSLSIDSLSINF